MVLAGTTHNRRLLWLLAALLTSVTFVVYIVQIPADAFTLHERFFVNRVLAVVTLLLIAWVLFIWMNSVGTSEAQLIKEQEEKIDAAKISTRLVEMQEAERRALANELHDLVGRKLAVLSLNLNIAKGQLLPDRPARIDSPLAACWA